ncbi:MAG: Xaa-Pro aminopeptidase [Paracoccaceae bacterium]|jgi:Xaa-Pro aminopeptidase
MTPTATAEHRRRVNALQHGMAAAGIDAMLLTAEPDVRYVTGFLTRFWESPTRPWFVVVPGAGDPVAVIPAIGAALMAKTWITDIRSWDAPAPQDDGVTLLAEALREMLPRGGRIGTPIGAESHLRMPLGDFARLRGALPNTEVIDATPVMHRAREVKSAMEIVAIRAACAVGDAGFAAVASFARPGAALSSVFRDFQIACLTAGADWVPYLAGGAGPDGYDDVISPATAAPLAPGDVLMIDTGAVVDGYFCDFDRNFAVGHASDTARRAYDLLYASTDAGLAAARPGISAADLHRAMANSIAAGGGTCLGGRLGHGLGMQLTEWPSLQPGDATVLRPGMVLTLEPGVETAPGRIMVAEENILITETGCELLSTRAPAALPVLV